MKSQTLQAIFAMGNGLISLDPKLAMYSPHWLDTEVSPATHFTLFTFL